MDTNMKATLCEKTLENTHKSHPEIRGCMVHSDYAEVFFSYQLFSKVLLILRHSILTTLMNIEVF